MSDDESDVESQEIETEEDSLDEEEEEDEDDEEDIDAVTVTEEEEEADAQEEEDEEADDDDDDALELPTVVAKAPLLKIATPKSVAKATPLKIVTATKSPVKLVVKQPVKALVKQPVKLAIKSKTPVKAPVKLAVKAPVKQKAKGVKSASILVQPTSVSEIESKLEPKKSREVTKEATVIIPTQLVEQAEKKSPELPLDQLLIKEEDETNDFFLMRSQYARVAQQLFPKHGTATFVLLGRYGANRAKYGVSYPDDVTPVLDFIDSTIMKQ